MAKEAKAEGEEDLKSLGTMIAQILDMTDIIFGSLVLYLIYVWRAFDASKVFISTGYSFIDIGLLACAAAFVGKFLTLATHILMAIIELILDFKSKRYKRLRQLVSDKLSATPIKDLRKNPVDIAVDLIAVNDPKAVDRLREIEAKAQVCLEGALVGIPYAWYLASKDLPWLIKIAPAFGTLLLFIYGALFQSDHLTRLLTILGISEPVGAKKEQKSMESLEFTLETETPEPDLHNAARLLASLAVIRFALGLAETPNTYKVSLTGDELTRLQEHGKHVLETSEYSTPPELRRQVTQYVLEAFPRGAFTLKSLEAGSVRGEIHDLFKKLLEKLGDIMSKSVTSPEAAIQEAIKAVNSASGVNREIAAGIAASGISEMNDAAKAMAAKAMRVRSAQAAA